jgi:hypothetical protein
LRQINTRSGTACNFFGVHSPQFKQQRSPVIGKGPAGLFGTYVGTLASCRAGRRSVQRAAPEQVPRRLDRPFAVPEHPIAVATDKIKLMLAAFPVHGPDIVDGMRRGHLRDEFRAQVHFDLRPFNERSAREYQLLEHQSLGSDHERGGALIGVWHVLLDLGRHLPNGGHCNRFRML